jgi:putative transposase
MLQLGWQLLDADGGRGCKRYLIVDRDRKYSKRFRDFIVDGGTEVIRLPPLSPNLNAFAERFVRSIKEECLTKMICVGQGSLRRALTEYMTHFNEERNHQGLQNRLIRGMSAVAAKDASIHRRARLGGMLSFYHRAAA